MKKLTQLSILLLSLTLVSACASVAGNYPVRQLPESRSTVTGLKPEFQNSPVVMTALYNGSDQLSFFQYKEGWLDPQAAIKQSAESLHQQSGGMPVEKVLLSMRQMPKYKLLFQLAEEGLVVYRLGVDLPPELLVNFQSAGALSLVFSGENQVPSRGIIVPQQFSPIEDWADSRRQVATLSSSSNEGKPAGWPHIVFVLMPRSSYGQRVVKVTANEGMSFSGHAALALK